MGIYFYKTGKIHALPVEQKTAIEIGILAISIYNHTLDFAFCDKKAEGSYYKMQFSLNPISYMLRICDDMQEWDREYFEIKAISNLLFCPKCFTPLRRTTLSYNEYLEANNIPVIIDNINAKEKCYEYWCMCGKSFTKKDDFMRRKLMNIKACNEVIVHLDDSIYNYMEVCFNYDNFKLLRLCTLQLTFTKYRCNEIQKLKKFVERQSFVDSKNKGYKGIFIKHNLTPNPMLLKMFILRDFLNRLKEDERIDTPKSPLNAYKNIKERYIKLLKHDPNDSMLVESEKLSKQLVDVFFKDKELEYINVIVQNCKFYLLLLIYEHYVTTISEKDKIKVYSDWLENQIDLNTDDLRYLLYMDAIEQIKKTYKPHEFEQIGTDYYNSYLNTKSKTYLDIEYYCNEDNELNKKDKESVKSTILSYYTDLYLYNKINELTRVLVTVKNK